MHVFSCYSSENFFLVDWLVFVFLKDLAIPYSVLLNFPKQVLHIFLWCLTLS